jgi:hypothetical protein
LETARIISPARPGFSIQRTASSSGAVTLSRSSPEKIRNGVARARSSRVSPRAEAVLEAQIEHGGVRLPVLERDQRLPAAADRADDAETLVGENAREREPDGRLVLDNQDAPPPGGRKIVHVEPPPRIASAEAHAPMRSECDPRRRDGGEVIEKPPTSRRTLTCRARSRRCP